VTPQVLYFRIFKQKYFIYYWTSNCKPSCETFTKI